MKVRSKNIGLVVLLIIFALSMAMYFAMNTSKNVALADTDVEEFSTFEIVDGASVRVGGETGNGLRYAISMSKDDYDNVTSKYTNFNFGIIIAPASYEKTYGEFNEANLFSNDSIYDWAELGDNGWVYNGTKTRVINLSTDKLDKFDKNENYGFYGSIVELNPNNIDRQFNAVGYIKYDDNGTKYIIKRGDNVRSMLYVAQKAIEAGEHVDKLKELYVNNEAVKNKMVDYFYEYNFENLDGSYSKRVVKAGESKYGETVQVDDFEVEDYTYYIDGYSEKQPFLNAYVYDEENENNVTSTRVYAINGGTKLSL